MGRLNNLVLAFSAFLFLLSAAVAIPSDIGNSQVIPVDGLQKGGVFPENQDLTTYASPDSGFSTRLLQQETELGLNFLRPLLLANPNLIYFGVPAAGKITFKKAALIIPALSGRTLIFPFHSFF